MSYANVLWWIQVLQCSAILGTTASLGAGLLQSLVVMPSLRPHEGQSALPSIQHTAALLQKSERFFPPLNIASEACNLFALVISFFYRHECPLASDKFPVLTIAFCFYVSITAYVFRIMIPMNTTILELRCKLEKDPEGEQSVEIFKRVQERWRQRNLGRVALKACAAGVGLYGLLKGLS